MKPQFRSRWFMFALIGCCIGGLTSTGCLGPLFRGEDPKDVEKLVESDSDDDGPRYIGRVTRPWGFEFAKIEGLSIATQLKDTGSSPRPGVLREKLASEMLTRDVKDSDGWLDTPTTAMVLVRGILPPGLQKGERFDIDLQVPTGSETTSLAGGNLLRTRLRSVEFLGGSLKSGHVVGLAQGPVIIDTAFDGTDDTVLRTRGTVLGGGVATISRPFGLHMRENHQSIAKSSSVAKAINDRFVAGGRYQKRGAAEPKTNKTIEMSAPRQYKNNLGRFVRVVNNVVVREMPQQQMDRMLVLEKQLLEPTTSALAALRLEAIGKIAVNTLLSALDSTDAEVRFYAAEALAYLERPEAVGVLEATARDDSMLRWHALTALSCMDDVEAGVALTNLLESNSAETAYGAFRALRARSESDPVVQGDILGDGFSFHVIVTEADPIVHFSRARRPEMVLFGHDHRLNENFLYRGGEWVIRGTATDTIKVSRFSLRSKEKHEICRNRLEEVVRAIDRLGGGYRDVLELVKQAKESDRLNSRIVINAVPMPQRRYQRKNGTQEEKGNAFSNLLAGTPLPELFRDRQTSENSRSRDSESVDEPKSEERAPSKSKPSLLGRIKSWFSST
jgi:flagellar basal body P-ring protein FlgI